MNKKPNVAIIGIGTWGKNLLSAFVRQGVEVSHCFHKGSKENVLWLSEKYPQIISVSKYEEILNNTSIDIITIATPISTHFELTEKAIKANKHIFLEKPGTETSDEIEKLYSEANDRKLIMAIGFVFAYHPACQYIKVILTKEKIKNIDFKWEKWGTFNEDIVLNLLTHELSILKILGLEINLGTLKYKYGDAEKKDILNVHAQSTNQVPITIHIDRLNKNKRKSVTVVTDQSTYIWENNELYMIEKGGTRKPITISSQPALDIEVADFLKDIHDQRQSLTDGKFARDILSITDSLSLL